MVHNRRLGGLSPCGCPTGKFSQMIACCLRGVQFASCCCCSRPGAFCFLLCAFGFLLFAFCFVLCALCFLLFAFCFLLFALCFVLFAFLLFAFCFLLFAFLRFLFFFPFKLLSRLRGFMDKSELNYHHDN